MKRSAGEGVPVGHVIKKAGEMRMARFPAEAFRPRCCHDDDRIILFQRLALYSPIEDGLIFRPEQQGLFLHLKVIPAQLLWIWTEECVILAGHILTAPPGEIE